MELEERAYERRGPKKMVKCLSLSSNIPFAAVRSVQKSCEVDTASGLLAGSSGARDEEDEAFLRSEISCEGAT